MMVPAYKTAVSLRPLARPPQPPQLPPTALAVVPPPAPESLLDRARTLVRTIEESYYDLALSLAELVRTGVPASLGYGGDVAGFTEFLQVELGLGYRKGRYLLAVAETFRGAAVEPEKVARIGWTKAREMSGVPVDALPGLVEFARSHSVPEVALAARQARGASEAAGPARRQKKSYPFHADQAELVETAIVACRESAQNPVDDAQALYLIAAQWLMQQGELLPVAAAIAVLEQAYGITLRVEEPAP